MRIYCELELRENQFLVSEKDLQVCNKLYELQSESKYFMCRNEF